VKGWLVVVFLGACARTPAWPTPVVQRGALREAGLRAPEDPTVRGARLLPDRLDEARVWGVEPGGGVRAIVSGVRVVSFANGSIVGAPVRLPGNPSDVVELPERLGGGFLFPVQEHLWRSESWLGPVKPILTAPFSIAQAMLGLDRAYVRSAQGTPIAFDPRTGAPLDLGPVPRSPHLGRIAAIDGWRAVAIADLQGVVATLDAGSTWRRIALPIDPTHVVALEDRFAIGGLDPTRTMQWWEVRSDGQTGWLAAPPTAGEPAPTAPPTSDPLARAFGPRPLATAVADGWPLADGTALVARDGALGRVRISDGTLVEAVPGAFGLRPARCRAIPMGHPGDPTAFGFVCGEPRATTAVYRWDPARARMVELRRFDDPRQVLASGNGALAVRGGCSADASGATRGDDQAFCLLPSGGAWSEMHLRGEDVDRARLVVLSDGRVALVRPPRDGELSSAGLTLTNGVQAVTYPLSIPPLAGDAARALRLGLWMDGFEERRPGVLGGWVDAGGSVVGLEIGLDGAVRVGEFIRDAGAPIVSGRWGFGWTASRRGFETTDGGMTWAKQIELPDPMSAAGAGPERACGPIGCLVAGWLRVGWGEVELTSTPEPPPTMSLGANRTSAALPLDCEPVAARSDPRGDVPVGVVRAAGRSWSMTVTLGPVSGPVSSFPPFFGRSAPAVPPDAVGVWREVGGGPDKPLRPIALAHLYAWGPRSGEWDQLGRWQIRWQWPWGSAGETRSSTAARPPWSDFDAARRTLGAWGSMAPGDDADHALLFAKRSQAAAGADVLVLESDRPPVEVQRPGGDPFPEVEAAARLAGRWYVATTQSPGERGATVLWTLDGTAARELGRVPRAGFETRPPVHLARRGDGAALGLVFEGQADRRGPMLWVVGVDLETGAIGDAEPLAPADLSDRAVSICSGDDGGWEVDLPYPSAVKLRTSNGWSAGLQSTMARMRISSDHACVERLLGSADAFATTEPSSPGGALRSNPPLGARSVEVSLLAARTRTLLRCWRR